MLGVRHLRMKLQSVDRQRPVFDGGVRTGLRGGNRSELGGQVVNLIAVTHPDLKLGGHTVEQAAGGEDSAGRLAKLACVASDDLASLSLTRHLHAVANTQNRNAEMKNLGVGLRRTFAVHAGRAA